MMWACSPDIRSPNSKKAERTQSHNPDEGSSDTNTEEKSYYKYNVYGHDQVVSHWPWIFTTINVLIVINILIALFIPAVGVDDHNFCRNPDGSEKPWCYVSELNGVGQKEACDVTICQGSHFHFFFFVYLLLMQSNFT